MYYGTTYTVTVTIWLLRKLGEECKIINVYSYYGPAVFVLTMILMLCDDIIDCIMVMIILFTESAGELVIHSYLPESGPATHNNKEEMIILTGKLPKGKSITI